MYEWFISRRYLRAKHRHGFISLISLISVIGITVGVIALIVVLSVYSGFTDGLRDQILGINSHIIVQRVEGSIDNYELIQDRVLSVQGVEGATPYLYAQTLLSGSTGGAGIILRGIDPQTAKQVVSLSNQMIAGTIEDLAFDKDERLPPIIIGAQLASDLRVQMGGKEYSPPEISAMILQKIKQDAEAAAEMPPVGLAGLDPADAEDRGLKTGDRVRIPPATVRGNKPGDVPPSVMQLLQTSIRYEDDSIMVIDKPAGMAVHAGSGLGWGVIDAV